MLARVLSFSLVIALAGPALARGNGQGAAAGGGRTQKQARIRERIRTLRTVLLVDHLALDETTAAKLAAVLAKFDAQMETLAVDGAAVRQALQQAVDDKAATDQVLASAVDAVFDHQAKRAKLERERFDAARQVLSARQAARAVLAWPQIDREIRQRVRRAMEGGGMRPREGGETVNPFDDGGKRPHPRRRPKPASGGAVDPYDNPE